MTDLDTRNDNDDDDGLAAPAPVRPLADDADPDVVARPYRWLTVAWPLAVVFHLLANISPIPLAAALQLAAAALATLVLLRPRLAYVLALATVFPVITLVKAPFVGNHELILAFTSLIVVGSGLVSGRRWPQTALPILRWLLIIAYASIAISKLNASFLDPSVSCAVDFADEFSGWLGLQASEYRSLSLVAIWTTVIVELSIPVMLLVRRFRVAGVLLAMVFHFILSLEPAGHVYDFTATLFPLFLAFAPAEVRGSLTDRIEGLVGGLGRSVLAFGALLVFVAHIFVLVTFQAPFWIVAYPAWLVVGFTVLWWIVTSVADGAKERGSWAGERVQARGPLVVLVPLVTVLAVNAVAPYVQLRTATAFNMYSNLETVGVDGDHPLAGLVGGVRDHDLVLITDAPDDHPLEYYVTEERAVPADNLRWYQGERLAEASPEDLANDDQVTLRWLSGSSVVDGPTRLSDLEVGDRGWSERFAHKLGFVRAVDLASPAGCLRSWGPAG